jgi:hypothetical protein
LSNEARKTDEEGTEEVGLAAMLSDLIRQNLEQNPSKWADFNKLATVVSIEVIDAEVTVTLTFARGALDIHTGALDSASIRISTTAELVLALCMVKISHGIPNFFERHGGKLLGSLLKGEVRIAGIARHPIQLVRFTRLMSVNV